MARLLLALALVALLGVTALAAPTVGEKPSTSKPNVAVSVTVAASPNAAESSNAPESPTASDEPRKNIVQKVVEDVVTWCATCGRSGLDPKNDKDTDILPVSTTPKEFYDINEHVAELRRRPILPSDDSPTEVPEAPSPRLAVVAVDTAETDDPLLGRSVSSVRERLSEPSLPASPSYESQLSLRATAVSSAESSSAALVDQLPALDDVRRSPSPSVSSPRSTQPASPTGSVASVMDENEVDVSAPVDASARLSPSLSSPRSSNPASPTRSVASVVEDVEVVSGDASARSSNPASPSRSVASVVEDVEVVPGDASTRVSPSSSPRSSSPQLGSPQASPSASSGASSPDPLLRIIDSAIHQQPQLPTIDLREIHREDPGSPSLPSLARPRPRISFPSGPTPFSVFNDSERLVRTQSQLGHVSAPNTSPVDEPVDGAVLRNELQSQSSQSQRELTASVSQRFKDLSSSSFSSFREGPK